MRNILLLGIISSFLIGCGPKPTPPVPIPPRPPQSETAKVSLKDTQKNIDSSIDENTKISKDIKDQKDNILNQRIEIAEALARAEKIKNKLISENNNIQIEMVDLIDQMKKVETRNLFLENKNTSLEGTNNNQKKLLDDARKNANDTMEKLLRAESEINELRRLNDFLGSNLNSKNNEVVSLQKKTEQLGKDLENARVYKRWTIGAVLGGIIFILISTGLWFVVKFYKPF